MPDIRTDATEASLERAGVRDRLQAIITPQGDGTGIGVKMVSE